MRSILCPSFPSHLSVRTLYRSRKMGHAHYYIEVGHIVHQVHGQSKMWVLLIVHSIQCSDKKYSKLHVSAHTWGT